MKATIAVVGVLADSLLGGVSAARADSPGAPHAEKVTFESDGLTLVGYLYHLEGTGP